MGEESSNSTLEQVGDGEVTLAGQVDRYCIRIVGEHRTSAVSIDRVGIGNGCSSHRKWRVVRVGVHRGGTSGPVSVGLSLCRYGDWRGLARVRRVAPRRLCQSVPWLVVSEWGEVGRAGHRVAPSGGDVGDVGELVRQVGYGRRGEAAAALDGGLGDVPWVVVGKDGDTAGRWEPRGVGARDSRRAIWQLMLRNEDVR